MPELRFTCDVQAKFSEARVTEEVAPPATDSTKHVPKEVQQVEARCVSASSTAARHCQQPAALWEEMASELHCGHLGAEGWRRTCWCETSW